MRARRTKCSETWLNIKPKVYEFSEDEVDMETESEDDVAKETEMNQARRTQGKQSTAPIHVSETLSKSRHRRGRSKTLQAQYINLKGVRVTVGAWNVAGRTPLEDLEIDEWLRMEEPADMYVLGSKVQRRRPRPQGWLKWRYFGGSGYRMGPCWTRTPT